MKSFSLILILSLLVSLSFFNGCGGKKYADAEEVITDYAKVMDEFLAKLDKSENAKDVASAINNYADEIERIMPRMKKIEEKYPELKDANNIPEELRESQKKVKASGQKFADSMMKIMPYMNDPEVQKAQERMNKVMMEYEE